MSNKFPNNIKIAIVGLGYVGLPLAVEFGKTKLAPVIGFDINTAKINLLKKGVDPTGELKNSELSRTDINYTDNPPNLKQANFIIIAVPTPVTQAKKPDLSLVKRASQIVGQNLQKGSLVVYESTVYPGVTEEICAPILEKESKLKCGIDFKIGYSPERINPGDKEHTIDKIIKIVAGQDKESLEIIAQVYSLVCKAGIHKAPNIKTAEAAKVIENIQRDLNIALVNELVLIFGILDISTKEVLEAAATKWNFHKYQPGLVGGHCIGVDPYYLVYKAEEIGYHPQVITAGRRINDSMPEYAAELMIKGLNKANKNIKGARVLIMGLTFKENVKDIRNSKIKDVVNKLKEYKIEVLGYDPLISEKEINKEFGIKAVTDIENLSDIDGVILSVTHEQFKNLRADFYNKIRNGKLILVDIKSFYFGQELTQNKNIIYKYF